MTLLSFRLSLCLERERERVNISLPSSPLMINLSLVNDSDRVVWCPAHKSFHLNSLSRVICIWWGTQSGSFLGEREREKARSHHHLSFSIRIIAHYPDKLGVGVLSTFPNLFQLIISR